jgi:hypothetical protein
MLNFFRDRPYSLIEIRQTLDDISEKTSLLDLIERHHDYLEESIPVLTDKMAPIDEKQKHLTRFLHLLNMHTKAEEETVYQGLLASTERSAHLEGIACQNEHDLAAMLAEEVDALNFESNWSEEADAKARVLASLVENHIIDEERSLFSEVRRDIPAQILKKLRFEYIEKCKHYLDVELSEARRSLSDQMIEKGL